MKLSDIEVAGGLLPVLDEGGYTVTANKIWSENTGRSTITGFMTGDIIAIKHTISLSWAVLSENELKKILDFFSSIESSFFNVVWHSPQYGEYHGTFYAADPTYKVNSFTNGRLIYTEVAVDLIEQ